MIRSLAVIEADLIRRGLSQRDIELMGRAYIAKYSEDQPRVPAGNPNGGQWVGDNTEKPTEDQSAVIERTAANYRGIKNISFAPTGTTDQAIISENKKIIDETLDLLPPSAYADLNALYVTNGTFGPLGAAFYAKPNADRRYVSDEIVTNQPWIEKSSENRKATLLHEFGHRMQLKTHKPLFAQFKRDVTVADHAKTLLGQYYKNYPKATLAGEVFAESFALFKTGQPLATELQAFWRKTQL